MTYDQHPVRYITRCYACQNLAIVTNLSEMSKSTERIHMDGLLSLTSCHF